MKRISLEVSDELFAQIDTARGDVPRNRWIRRAIETALAEAAYGPGATAEFGDKPSKERTP